MSAVSPLKSLSVIAVICGLLAVLLRPVDQQFLSTRYLMRGEISADTNIVIVYLDNEDIRSLGGWPLQRAYYALIIDMLRQWGAKTIGFDILFDSPSSLTPEYDFLLADRIANGPPVIMTSYGRTVSEDEVPLSVPERFFYSASAFAGAQQVAEIVAPFPVLLEQASGIGHSNLEPASADLVPSFLSTPHGLLPAFGFETAREYLSVPRSGISFSNNTIRFPLPNGKIKKIRTDSDGYLHLNHPGTLSVFRSVRFPLLLKEDGIHRTASEVIGGKIVLIGVIAEGRSGFVPSPFGANLPSVAHHATIVDNILQSRFLRYPAVLTVFLIGMGSVVLGYGIVGLLHGGKGLLTATACLVLYLAGTMYSFSVLNYVWPVMMPVIGLMAGSLIMFVYYVRNVKSRLDTLEEEKERIVLMLEEREDRLKKIQEELDIARRSNDAASEIELERQVHVYEAEIHGLQKQIDDTEAEETDPHDVIEEFEEIMYNAGRGPMSEVVGMLAKVAPTDAPVLLLGESGTGKELAARAIHTRSSRSGRAFIAVNCGALSETLIESELFGHEKGAFTGAIASKPGRFELANGGTIFLDEVAETSEAFQVKLLRVLQEGTFEKVGGTETKKVNVRIVAATNRDIESVLKEKKFRDDLYYRLNVFSITLPPLRDRRFDIPLLVSSFAAKHSPDLRFSKLAAQALSAYHWPGNIRELQAAIQRAALLALSDKRAIIRLGDLPKPVADSRRESVDMGDRVLEEIRHRRFSRSAVSQTARELGDLNRGTVAEYLRGNALEIFAAEDFNIEKAVRRIAGTSDPDMCERAERKLKEYLGNIAGSVDRNSPFHVLEPDLSGKYKNLPLRYHESLTRVIRGYYSGKWDLPSGTTA